MRNPDGKAQQGGVFRPLHTMCRDLSEDAFRRFKSCIYQQKQDVFASHAERNLRKPKRKMRVLKTPYVNCANKRKEVGSK